MCPRGSCCGRQLEPRPEANQSTRFRQARRSCDGSPATIRGGGNPTLNMALAPRFRMGPPPRSSPPMRTSASWVRTHAVRRIQGCGALALPQGGLPSGRRCASRVPAPAQPLSANQHPEERPCSALDRSSPIQAQVNCERPLQPLRNRGEEQRRGVGARETILTEPGTRGVAESSLNGDPNDLVWKKVDHPFGCAPWGGDASR